MTTRPVGVSESSTDPAYSGPVDIQTDEEGDENPDQEEMATAAHPHDCSDLPVGSPSGCYDI